MMNKKMVLFYISLLLYFFFPTPLFEWDLKIKALIALIIIQILWIGRVFPLAHSSILLILILSFHFFSYEETMSTFGSGLVWLLFSTLILSNAFIETGLASRISLKMLRLSKGSGKQLIFISFMLMFVLSVFIPSNIGKGSLIASVLDRIAKSMEKIKSVPNLSKSIFIGLAYVVSISGAFVATGASSTIYAYGMFLTVSSEMNYMHWILYFAPPILIFIFLLWLVLLFCFPPENMNREIVLNLIDERIQNLGKMSPAEIKMLAIIGLTLLLWVTQSLHGYSIPLIGMLGAGLTLMPMIGVWEWKEAGSKMDWDLILFFASTLMLSKMLIDTGTIHWLADELVRSTSSWSPLFVLIFLVLCVALIRIIFVNVLGFLTIMIPLAITLGENISSFSPLVIAMAVFLTGVPGFLLITQSPVHLISYSYGYFSEKDLFRVGMLSQLLWLVVVFTAIFFYWNLIL